MSLVATAPPTHIHLPSINNLPFPSLMFPANFDLPYNQPIYPLKNAQNMQYNFNQNKQISPLEAVRPYITNQTEEESSYSSKTQSDDEFTGYKLPPTYLNPPPKKVTPTKGSWSQHEDDLLRQAVANCSPILWDVIAEQVPGRSAIQCKERWLYRLHPEVKKTRFEKWEDDLIIRERNLHGNHWTLIANKLPGRTSCAVKNRWYSVLRNKDPNNNA